MDAQELRNLQETYMEVYNELDEGAVEVAARARKLARRRNQTPETKEMYERLAAAATTRATYGFGSPRPSRFERSQEHGPVITPASSQRASETGTLGGATYQRGPKRLPKSTKYIRQVLSGVRAASSQEKRRLRMKAESYDLYDIILSHLLDEGYGETPEAAERIMVHMSEDWKDSICEELTSEIIKRYQ
jgi:hypothetical protein